MLRGRVLKSFSKDLLELGTGGVGINFRPLESSLTLSSERALLEKFFMYFLFLAVVLKVKEVLRCLHLWERFL